MLMRRNDNVRECDDCRCVGGDDDSGHYAGDCRKLSGLPFVWGRPYRCQRQRCCSCDVIGMMAKVSVNMIIACACGGEDRDDDNDDYYCFCY